VNSALRRLLGLMLLAGALILGGQRAQAHPHVWITASSEVIYATDGSITGVRHAWTFDDMFSTYALQGLQTKTKGAYSREELEPLAQTNVESLKEYGSSLSPRPTARRRNSRSRSTTTLNTGMAG
jgi:ABC-type uncharacterized transport system substrate-binding protein